MFVIIIFLLLVSTRICNSIFCNDGSNPCQLDQSDSANAYFTPMNGYYCLDAFGEQFVCTCPDNSTRRNRPCRICDQNPNPCGNSSSVVTCTDINQSFSCLCNDGHGGLIVSTKPCDNITIIIPSEETCDNDGVRDPITNQCNCPSGFTGDRCEIQLDSELCLNIECMSRGICTTRPIIVGGTVYQSKCLCRAGSDGEYCEKQSVMGLCTPTYCLNEGICQQRDFGDSHYIICQCKSGWIGARCEKQYFRCRSSGYFIDEFMKNQGKYFWCIPYNNEYLLKQKSCPKGLKLNVEKQLCLR